MQLVHRDLALSFSLRWFYLASFDRFGIPYCCSPVVLPYADTLKIRLFVFFQ